MRPGGLGNLVGSPQVDVDNGVPEAVVHVGEGLVTQDTSIVDQDINAAKAVNGRLDDGFAVLAGSLVANSLATHLLNLLDNGLGVDQVIDDDGGTELGEQQAVGAAETKESETSQKDGDGHTRYHRQ